MANVDDTPVKLKQAKTSVPREIDFESMQNEDFISYKVSVLSRIMDRNVDKRMLASRGLSLSSLRVLGHLFTHGDGRVFGIARKMHMLASQVSKGLMELVESGHVVKVVDPGDRRGTIFRVSTKGRTVYERIIFHALDKQREVASLVGMKNYLILSECLDILINHYGEQKSNRDTGA